MTESKVTLSNGHPSFTGFKPFGKDIKRSFCQIIPFTDPNSLEHKSYVMLKTTNQSKSDDQSRMRGVPPALAEPRQQHRRRPGCHSSHGRGSGDQCLSAKKNSKASRNRRVFDLLDLWISNANFDLSSSLQWMASFCCTGCEFLKPSQLVSIQEPTKALQKYRTLRPIQSQFCQFRFAAFSTKVQKPEFHWTPGSQLTLG